MPTIIIRLVLLTTPLCLDWLAAEDQLCVTLPRF